MCIRDSFNAGDWQQLNEHILLLAKRRSQLKQASSYGTLTVLATLYHQQALVVLLQAVQAFVRQAMDYVEKTPNEETKVELIKTLQSVTEGKVDILDQNVVASEYID